MNRLTWSRSWCPNSASPARALTRTGQVKAAHNETTLKAAIDEADWMKREMGDAEVRILDKRGKCATRPAPTSSSAACSIPAPAAFIR